MASIQKKKNGKYAVRYSVYENGKRHQPQKTVDKAREAKELKTTVEGELLDGSYSDAKGRTTGQYLDEWYELFCEGRKGNYKYNHKNNIDTHIKPVLGHVPLEDLSAVEIQRLYNKMPKTAWLPAKYEDRDGLQVLVRPARYYSPKTVLEVHGTLNAALKKAIKPLKLIKVNPCDGIDLPAYEPPEFEPPSVEVERALLAACRQAETYPLIMAAALTGARRGEVAGFTWPCIDLDAMTADVKNAYIYNKSTKKWELSAPKSKKSKRLLELPPVLVDELRARKAKQAENRVNHRDIYQFNQFVYTREDGTPFAPPSISQAFKRAAARIGHPELRLHDLRHAFVTELLDMGYSPNVVQEMVGHSSAAFTLKRYAHAVDARKRQAANAFGARLVP